MENQNYQNNKFFGRQLSLVATVLESLPDKQPTIGCSPVVRALGLLCMIKRKKVYRSPSIKGY